MNKFFQFNEKDLFKKSKVAKLTNDNLIIENGNGNNLLYRFKNYLVNNSSVFIYIIISFIWVVQEILLLMFWGFLKDIDFWFLEILTATIIFSKIFLVEVYKHQKLAIGINLIIPSIFKIIAIIFRFKSEEKIIYTKYPWWVPIGLIGYIILISIKAFINCSIRSFIDLKYITISQLLIFYSFIGIIVSIIADVIITFVPCSKDSVPNFVNGKMCKVKYNKYLYFDNLIYYFSSFTVEDLFGNLIRALFIIFDFTSLFFKEYFYLSVIKYMGPTHITSSLPIFFFLKKVVIVMNNLIIKKAFITDASDYKLHRFFVGYYQRFYLYIWIFDLFGDY